MPLAIAPNTIDELPVDAFNDSPSIPSDRRHPLYAKVLVNFSPGTDSGGILTKDDLRAIVFILRGVARQPGFGVFSIVAFSLDEQRVLYRRTPARSIDFSALRNAVKSLHPGTVDLRQLADPESGPRFLADLLVAEFRPQQPKPDALIVISPKVMLDRTVSKATLSAARVECPVFYLNCNAYPRRNPWRGTIGSALRVYHALQYSITGPRDLSSALTDMGSKLPMP